MKRTKTLIKIFSMLFILLMIHSCIESYEISTRINPDGSLVRTIRVVATDSTSFFDGRLKLPHPNDTLWEITMRPLQVDMEDLESDEKYEYIASRTFVNADELNEYLKIDADTALLMETNVQLKKRFLWFNTYYSYTEIYRKSMQFNHYPVEEFIDSESLPFFYDENYTYDLQSDRLVHVRELEELPLLSAADSLRMAELEEEVGLRVIRFALKNWIEEYLNLLTQWLPSDNEHKGTDISKDKEMAFNYLLDKERVGSFFFAIGREAYQTVDSLLGIDGVSYEIIPTEELERFLHKSGAMISGYSSETQIHNKVIMPGSLLSTNADSISQNEVYWNFNEKYFFVEDYPFVVKSKVTNVWAIVLTGFIIAGLLFAVYRYNRR